MRLINLHTYYPFIFSNDVFISVPDEIANIMEKIRRDDHAEYELKRVHKAYFSLDIIEGSEIKYKISVPSPEEVYINYLDKKELYLAILSLPEKQRNRLYAHYFHGLKFTEIALMENISERTVRQSIEKALKNLRKK